MASRIRRLLVRLAVGSAPRYAEWGLRRRDFEEAIGREASLVWLAPLAVGLLGFVNPVLILTAPPLAFLTAKLIAARAAERVMSRRRAAERCSLLVISELRLAYYATGSLEKALLFVAEGDYPEVSQSLRKLLKRAEGGRGLVRGLLKYAETRAPPSLREFLPRFVRYPEDSALPLGLYRKLWEAYVEDAKRLRLGVLVFFGLSFLLPIPIALLLLLTGQVSYLPVATPVYVLSLALAARALMPMEWAHGGGAGVDAAAALLSVLAALPLLVTAWQVVSPASIAALAIAITSAQYFTLKKLHVRSATGSRGVGELEEVLRGLAYRLRLGMSLEVALQEVAQRHRGSLRPALIEAAKKVSGGSSVEEAVESSFSRPELAEARRLLLLVSKLSKCSSDRAGTVVAQVAELMGRDRALREKLATSLRREELKVKLLSAIYPMVLAALYQLAQVMAAVGWLTPGRELALNLSLATLSVATPFYATLIVMGQGALRRGLSSLLIYVVLQMVLMALPLSG